MLNAVNYGAFRVSIEAISGVRSINKVLDIWRHLVANLFIKNNFLFLPLIADIFFGVYEMAVDTLFLCFLEDIERNDGSPEKPYFMSKDLRKILGKFEDKSKPSSPK